MSADLCRTCGAPEPGEARCRRCGALAPSRQTRPMRRQTTVVEEYDYWVHLREAETDEYGLPRSETLHEQILVPAPIEDAETPTTVMRDEPEAEAPDTLYLCSPILGEPYPVGPGEPVVIGRGQDTTLMFPVKAISRRHTRIRYNGRKHIVEDLGSTNGTWLNGQPIQVAPLQDGDVLAIGPFEIRVAAAAAPADSQDGVSGEETCVVAMAPFTVTADLAQITASEIAQLLELNARSGQLIFQDEQEDTGVLVFERGRIIHAQQGGRSPREAALSLLQSTQGWVSFLGAPPTPTPATIQDPTARLLLEAAQRRDESARA